MSETGFIEFPCCNCLQHWFSVTPFPRRQIYQNGVGSGAWLHRAVWPGGAPPAQRVQLPDAAADHGGQPASRRGQGRDGVPGVTEGAVALDLRRPRTRLRSWTGTPFPQTLVRRAPLVLACVSANRPLDPGLRCAWNWKTLAPTAASIAPRGRAPRPARPHPRRPCRGPWLGRGPATSPRNAVQGRRDESGSKTFFSRKMSMLKHNYSK